MGTLSCPVPQQCGWALPQVTQAGQDGLLSAPAQDLPLADSKNTGTGNICIGVPSRQATAWLLVAPGRAQCPRSGRACSLAALAEGSECDTHDAPLGREGETLHQKVGAGILDSCPHLSEDTQGQGTQVEATLR